MRRGLVYVLGAWLLGGCSFGRSADTGRAAPQADVRAAFDKAQEAGFAALRRGDLTAAREHWEAARKIQPANPYVLTNLGLVEGALGEQEAALRHTGRAVQLAPRSPAVVVNHGFVLEAQGHVGQAVGAFRRALELDPRFGPALLAVGARAYVEGNEREAVSRFEDVVRFQPDKPDGYAGLAAVAAMREEWDKAAGQMASAAAAAPDDALYAAAAGALFYRAGDTERAGEYLDRALDLRPDLADALVLRAELAWRDADYVKAKELLTAAVEIDREGIHLAGSLLRRGELAVTLGQTRLAHDAIRKALTQGGQPKAWRGRAHVVLGALAVRGTEYAAAHEHYRKAEEILGPTAEVTAGLGASLHGKALTGRIDGREDQLREAETQYRRSLDRVENPRLRVALARLYVELADIVAAPYRRGKLRLAELHLRDALTREPGLVEGHARLAMLLDGLERHAEAREAFERALALDPGATRVRFLYANMLRKLADEKGDAALRDEAKRHYATLMEHDPNYVAAQIGWYLTAVTDSAPQMAGQVTGETPKPYGSAATLDTPILEDLLPFLDDAGEEPSHDNGVIPIKENDRAPIYSIEATGGAETTPAVYERLEEVLGE